MFPPPPFPLCINLREPTASAPRGATLSTHIEKYRSLIMPLVHGRKNPHSPVHLYFPSSSAFASSPPCGSRSVCELTHSVNKYASNEYPLEVRSARTRTAVSSRLRNFTFRVQEAFERAFRIKASPSSIINYSLLIINFHLTSGTMSLTLSRT